MIHQDSEPIDISSDPSGQVAAIRLNEENTIKNVYTENYPAAEKYILLNKGSHEEAKDFYQEAFIAVWRNIKLGRFIPQNENSLKHYLLQVVKNKWLDHLRSAHYRNTIALNEEKMDQETEPLPEEQQEKINIIKHNFQKLGDICREVLQRFYYNREPLKKIAEAFKWTEATARNNKYRCIEQLRKSLQTK